MTDAQVGELWIKANNAPAILGQWADEMKALIRKLVAERESCYIIACQFHTADSRCHHRENALRDFGIDPATWGKP